MDRETLETKVSGYVSSDDCSTVYETREFSDCSLQRVRDKLLDVGLILEEDLEGGMYVAKVSVGPALAPSATLAAGVDANVVHVIAYSEAFEGADTAFAAVRFFFDAMERNSPKRRRRHNVLKVVLLAILLACFLAAIFWGLAGSRVVAAREATFAYNAAVEEFNSAVSTYNDAAQGLAVGNVRGLVAEAGALSIQPTDFLSITRQVLSGNDADKINADAQTVRNMTKSLADGVRVLEAINNPDEQWVVDSLGEVESIDAVESVTSEDDPNGLLGKNGGYTSCVYFTTTLVDPEDVAGDGPVAKGVDGGGAIEVYATADDARTRCEYLAEFNGTILDPGSYALVGTMVIRTSCLLVDDAQYGLTDEIVIALTQHRR